MSRNGKGLADNRGFSMIELMFVVGIMTILLGIVAYSGHELLVKSQVEGETRQLYSDLMNARVSALQKNRFFFVTLAPNQYAIYEDTNPSPDGNGALEAATDWSVKQATVSYVLSAGTMTTFNFTGGGLVSGGNSYIRVLSTGSPVFDCVTLETTRIHMGKWNGTNCIAK